MKHAKKMSQIHRLPARAASIKLKEAQLGVASEVVDMVDQAVSLGLTVYEAFKPESDA